LITAVDTNVLLDVFGRDPVFGERSAAALRTCLTEGSLVACEVVWAELRPAFPDDLTLSTAMDIAQIRFSPLDLPAALAAGSGWQEYRLRGGRRERLIGDFLILAHASTQADRLLTRNLGTGRSYFPALTIIDPAAV
jgi:predicted nucleic acid-binding protein